MKLQSSCMIRCIGLNTINSENEVFNINIQQIINQESAIWSKNCHPEELFLMPEVLWVHIYTWKDQKEPIIN